jgi:very-short-patch-repair endonuclease
MRKPVPPKLRQYAREMRNEPTDAEAVLWNILRGKKLEGMRFRRQHPIENYIVDFICLEEKLIIEVDGSQHAENTYDEKRDAKLKEVGFTVMRFWNDEIIKNSDDMAQMILAKAGKNICKF